MLTPATRKALLVGICAVVIVSSVVLSLWLTNGFTHNPFAPSQEVSLPVQELAKIPEKPLPEGLMPRRVHPVPTPAASISTNPSLAPKKTSNDNPSFVWPNDSTATINAITKEHEKLEKLKIKVAIAEQERRLKELSKEPAPSMPPIPPMPQLPNLAPHTPEKVLMPVVQKPRKETKLLGIQGMDGELSAVFSTQDSKRFVRKGDKILGSKVTSITLDAVTLANGTTFTLGH